MATIRNRGDGRYEAQIRRKGYPQQTKTFATKADAELWAAEVELTMRRGAFVCRREGETTTVADALERYRREVTAGKKSAVREGQRIDYLKREPFASKPLAALHGGDLAAWRDEKLKSMQTNSVRLYIAILSNLYAIAQKEWRMAYLDNPARAIRWPRGSNERERRLQGDEEQRLLEAAKGLHRDLHSYIIIAIETGMRRSELCGARREWIRGPVLTLPTTKNGKARAVPLSTRAREAIAALPLRIDGRLLTITADWVTRDFRRACEAAGITGLVLHDLRHEATSRLFEKGLGVMEVSAITGLSLAMLRRYTQLRAEDLARRLG